MSRRAARGRQLCSHVNVQPTTVRLFSPPEICLSRGRGSTPCAAAAPAESPAMQGGSAQIPLPVSALAACDPADPLAVLVYSRRSAEALIAALAALDVRGRLVFFALSEQVAEPLRGLGPCHVAAEPSEAALLPERGSEYSDTSESNRERCCCSGGGRSGGWPWPCPWPWPCGGRWSGPRCR